MATTKEPSGFQARTEQFVRLGPICRICRAAAVGKSTPLTEIDEVCAYHMQALVEWLENRDSKFEVKLYPPPGLEVERYTSS